MGNILHWIWTNVFHLAHRCFYSYTAHSCSTPSMNQPMFFLGMQQMEHFGEQTRCHNLLVVWLHVHRRYLLMGKVIKMWCRRLIRWHIHVWSVYTRATNQSEQFLSTTTLVYHERRQKWSTVSTSDCCNRNRSANIWSSNQSHLTIKSNQQCLVLVMIVESNQSVGVWWFSEIQPITKWLFVVYFSMTNHWLSINDCLLWVFSSLSMHHCFLWSTSAVDYFESTSPVIHVHHYQTWLANSTHQIVMVNAHQTVITSQY